MSDPRAPVFQAIRAAAGRNPFNDSAIITRLDALLDDIGVPRAGQAPGEPRWMIEARARIGEKEIPGPRHNSWIAKGWARLGATWFNDDETPWCGFFVAHCIDWAKLPYPRLFPRALEWSTWGQACPAAVGAVVTFQRPGGGHVGFLVGEDRTNYYVLGGNQSNMVNIQPIAKSRMAAIRWPSGMALPRPGLPLMSGGVVSTNER
jgi:uncharacterized protein (TIGR02594 family)